MTPADITARRQARTCATCGYLDCSGRDHPPKPPERRVTADHCAACPFASCSGCAFQPNPRGEK